MAEDLGRYEEAIQSYDRVLNIQLNPPEIWLNHLNEILSIAWCNRGVALIALEQYEDALQNFNYALESKPNYYKARINQGSALLILKHYEEAIASFDQAIDINPDSYEVWYNRGIALQSLERYQEADISYDEVLKSQPNHAATYYNKASCYGLQEKTKQAVDTLEIAIRLDAQHWEVARTDSCFDPIRQNEDFQQLLENSRRATG